MRHIFANTVGCVCKRDLTLRLNPDITLLNQFHVQKALLKVPKICNINFWIENEPTSPLPPFPKIHPIW